MKRFRGVGFFAVAFLALLAVFAAISRSSNTSTDSPVEQSFVSRADVRQQDAVTVRAAVLSDDESEVFRRVAGRPGHSGNLAECEQR